ncbi:Multidrug resistance-associated protein 4 [Branchiostoma belcheri]|nr:Multidrug resistance-associated protein 4 [Branchiostoma belcheri]
MFLELLEKPMNGFPEALAELAEVRISVKRLQTFLALDEYQPPNPVIDESSEDVCKLSPSSSEVVGPKGVTMDLSTATWKTKSVDRQDGKSALSQHELKAGHSVTNGPILDIVKIIDQESRKLHRKIKEAVHIQLERAGMNRNEGWELPKSYLSLLRKEAGENFVVLDENQPPNPVIDASSEDVCKMSPSSSEVVGPKRVTWKTNLVVLHEYQPPNPVMDESSKDLCKMSLSSSEVVGPKGVTMDLSTATWKTTALLCTIMRELVRVEGKVDVRGTLAFTAQEPWAFPDTIMNNIVDFGKPFDKDKYDRAISISELEMDIQGMPYGDKTFVGDRGVTLSGGQKARLGLARAVYADADIYLLDDPLSAVDAAVGKKLFDKCILGALGSKVRILVTHQLQFLNKADKILVLDKGNQVTFGTYEEVLASGADFAQLLLGKSDDDSGTALDKKGSTESSRINYTNFVEEERVEGSVSWRVYVKYLTSGPPRWVDSIAHLNKTLPSGQPRPVPGAISLYHLKMYAGLEGLTVLLTIISTILIIYATYRASVNLHNMMFNAVMRAPISFFKDYEIVSPECGELRILRYNSGRHDSTSMIFGREINAVEAEVKYKFRLRRVLNRFADDLLKVEEHIPQQLISSIEGLLSAIGAVVMICIGNPWAILPTCPLVLGFAFMYNYYMPTVRHLARLKATNASPIYTHVSAVMEGLWTIRALSAQENFKRRFRDIVDQHSEAEFLDIATNAWYKVRVKVLDATFNTFLTFMCILSSESLGAGRVGLTLSYALLMSEHAEFIVEAIKELESVARIWDTMRRFEETLSLSSEKKERKKSDCSHTEEGQAGGKQADCTPRLRSKGEGAVLKRPAGSDDPGRPRCTPARARRSGLTAITTDTITTPSRRQTGGSLSFQDENVSLWSPEARVGAGEAISREPGSEAPGAGRGVPVVGAVGSREREQQGPGNGSNRSREREQPVPRAGRVFGRATHGAVHGHFLPCTGMYRDRVRAYNVQYTTCTQKVVHFRECTGHVRDWTRFVCRLETPGFYRKPKISGKMINTERVIEYAELTPEAPYETDHKPPPDWPAYGAIDLKGVYLSYGEQESFVLKNVNLNIVGGEKVGIVGRTGAGKSSLLMMLMRLVEPTGSIRIDGVDIRKLGLHDLRKKISVIQQDPIMIQGTVRKNLDPLDMHSDHALWTSLNEVYMTEDIQKLPKGLDTPIGERGGSLSVGQKQLLCLARTILYYNRILLFDEATANIDLKTDRLIQSTIRERFKHCTVLTIAHRLNTVMDSDRIVVMDEGRVAEFDEPHLLLTEYPDSIFSKLVSETGESMERELRKAAHQSYLQKHEQKKSQ